MSLRSRTALSLAAAALGIAAVLAPGTSAWADGTAPVAWSVSPADAKGAADGRTRLEVALDPGKATTDHVTVANASTTEQTFKVYGADAFNTATGGYDLLAANVPSTDAGRWVTLDHETLTIPALSAATVAVTVTVPAGATPGDHAAGIVVSRAQPASDAKGVLIDSRVAVRLSVRVAGALSPALDVENVRVRYSPSWIPFAPADAHVTYQVHNRGNVTVVGEPRLRINGPFGTVLGKLSPSSTREVLPGQSFTVDSVLREVAPAVVGTAVVDVKTAAAPGPQTQIPLVSSTGRARFAAVPWSGLAVLVVIALAVRWFLRRRRRRRDEAEAMWAELVDQAKTGQLPDAAGRAGVVATVALGLALAGWLLLAPATSASAADPTPDSTQGPLLELSVPAPTASTTSSTVTSTSSDGTTTTTTFGGSSGDTYGGGAAWSSTGGSSGKAPGAAPEAVTPAPSSTAPGPTPSPTRTAASLPTDTVWRSPRGLSPTQRAAAAITAGLGLGAAGLAWRLVPLFRGRIPS